MWGPHPSAGGAAFPVAFLAPSYCAECDTVSFRVHGGLVNAVTVPILDMKKTEPWRSSVTFDSCNQQAKPELEPGPLSKAWGRECSGSAQVLRERGRLQSLVVCVAR